MSMSNHLLSDVAGSYSSRSKSSNNGGSGIPMPLFELFQLIGKSKFKVYQGNNKSNKYEEMTLADLSVRVFEEGNDFRFGLAQAIPVVINELMIRFLWALKSRFVDGIDAGLRSQGQVLRFALHLNFVAWKRLALDKRINRIIIFLFLARRFFVLYRMGNK
ncbi:MAG: hypothetical protein GX053_01205 [Tissierella sp.]|nr:hypothetical protein [Tissierella sp.]